MRTFVQVIWEDLSFFSSIMVVNLRINLIFTPHHKPPSFNNCTEFYTVPIEEHLQVALEIFEVGICSSL
jgi:hypothetical protein